MNGDTDTKQRGAKHDPHGLHEPTEEKKHDFPFYFVGPPDLEFNTWL
jgi:hypothetical protein